MKTYNLLIKHVKRELQDKYIKLEEAYQRHLNLERQIEHLIEMLEKEYMQSFVHKTFFNPTYFKRAFYKLKSYRYLITSTLKDIETIQDEMRELFFHQKKYEILLENKKRKLITAHQKKEREELEDLFRPDLKKF